MPALWRQFVFWCGQLFAIGGAAQVIVFLLGMSSDTETWLRAHIPSTIFALVLYFGLFPLYVHLKSDRHETVRRLREDDEGE